MNIQRINNYTDKRFKKRVLLEHGAFVIDDKICCSFKILNNNSAQIITTEKIDLTKIIDEFRFYSPQIIFFYDKDHNLIKKFDEQKIVKLSLREIQPSQFFANINKINAISTFIHSPKDIIIQIALINNQYVSLDGHTRLAYAVLKNYDYVYGCIVEDYDEYIIKFIEEAKKRNVLTPYNIKVISSEEYEIKWNKFCDDFFKEGENNNE